MSILITGGCGYIGSHTCVEMLKSGYDIVVIDNFYNSDIEALNRVKELSGTEFSGSRTNFTKVKRSNSGSLLFLRLHGNSSFLCRKNWNRYSLAAYPWMVWCWNCD